METTCLLGDSFICVREVNMPSLPHLLLTNNLLLKLVEIGIGTRPSALVKHSNCTLEFLIPWIYFHWDSSWNVNLELTAFKLWQRGGGDHYFSVWKNHKTTSRLNPSDTASFFLWWFNSIIFDRRHPCRNHVHMVKS